MDMEPGDEELLKPWLKEVRLVGFYAKVLMHGRSSAPGGLDGHDYLPQQKQRTQTPKTNMQVVMPVVAATDPSSRPTRKRPLIYVYDTWPEFNTDIQQYK